MSDKDKIDKPAVEPFVFGKTRIGPGEPVFIIAEIGINHEGDVNVCAEMVEAAARAGADSIKLQTIDPDANYVVGTESHDIFSGVQLSREETAKMFDLSRSLGMEPFTTAGDPATLEWVDRLGPAGHKISSGLMTHTPMVRRTAETGRPILMSTGLATVEEIDLATATLRVGGCSAWGIFQCTSLYPPTEESLNLATVRWLQDRYGVPTGFSDHSLGHDAVFLSIGVGAAMIEKHFTLDRTRPGLDHPISLDEAGFGEMVRAVRRAEAMMGQAEKTISPAEAERRAVMHRVLVAARDLPEGAVLGEEDITCKRPLPGTTGLTPMHFEATVGRTLACSLKRDDPIGAGDLA